MRKRLSGAVFAAAAGLSMLSGGAVLAAGGVAAPEREWSFEGVFGAFDRPALQRGYRVYREVCAACHSMRLMYYRNLTQIGLSEAAARQEAANAFILDGPDEEGEMFERPGKLSDRFVSPFPNDNAAMAANGGALPRRIRRHGPCRSAPCATPRRRPVRPRCTVGVRGLGGTA